MRTLWHNRWTAPARLLTVLVAIAALAFMVYDAQSSSRAADSTGAVPTAPVGSPAARDVRPSLRDGSERLYLPTSKFGRPVSQAQAERLLRAAGALVDERAGEGEEQPASPSDKER